MSFQYSSSISWETADEEVLLPLPCVREPAPVLVALAPDSGARGATAGGRDAVGGGALAPAAAC